MAAASIFRTATSLGRTTMKIKLLALALAATPMLAAPALAQSRMDEQRWQDAQRRFNAEIDTYTRERDRYLSMRSNGGDRCNGRYDVPAPRGDYRDPYTTDYDAARYYRDGSNYEERRLSAQDEVYRGSDGRYYCRRSDGTTGLIIGAGAGALIGNVAVGGRDRTAGTLVGGALGALLGRSVDQNMDVRCR